MYEIQNIEKELTRLRKRTKELNTRKRELTDWIVKDMADSLEETFVYNGKKYQLKESSRHSRKNEKKKRDDALNLLGDEGMHGEEAEEMYSKFVGALKGPEQTVYTLKKI